MKRFTLAILVASSLPLSAMAQSVPAINGNAYSGSASIPPLSADTIKLNRKEQVGVQLTNQWKNSQINPMRGENGTIIFPFGVTMPSIVCAPLHLTIVQLQEGEIIRSSNVGDSIRWKVLPANEGSKANGNETPQLIIKPTDVGLSTDLIITTNRRTYILKLLSKKDTSMVRVAFDYPEESEKLWQQYYEEHPVESRYTEEGPNQTSSHRFSSRQISNLQFNYKITGKRTSWTPTKIYADQDKTYIQFPENCQTKPVLTLIGNKNQEYLVNYRVEKNAFIVDTVIQKAALITGVGRKQQRIIIEKEG
jgi:P-type conjugative transfer protein TrbG